MLKRVGAIALVLSLISGALRADLSNPTGLTLNVKAGGKAISSDDIAFTQKSGYVHLMFNAAPYPAADQAALPSILKGLVQAEGLRQFPKTALFKVDVVDISVRDDYGLPAWDKIKLLGHYVVKAGKKGLQVSRLKAAP